jgi:tRNA(Ile)-lysidine synthase
MVPDQEFAAAMAPLGPFEPAPRIAAAVSGGPDSMALAVLADAWARARGGSLHALVVDHGLRPESAGEAAVTIVRLQALGIAATLLRIEGLSRGSALAERARTARFAVLEEACAAAGILHLLLGHHAGDQAETLLIRALAGSAPAGLAGMAALVEMRRLRVLRPLLAVPPVQLRATLEAVGVTWVEDPSNTDMTALRPRLRRLRGDSDGRGSATAALVAASVEAGRGRANRDQEAADFLAERVAFRPEGFALLDEGPLPPAAFAALLQALSGASFPPGTGSIEALAAAPRPATLAGVRLLPAGKLGAGLLAVRESAAMAAPIAARAGAVWDGRFRLGDATTAPPDATLGALDTDAAALRHFSPLPSAVLRTLPAIRRGSTLLAVPHLHYPDREQSKHFPVLFSPLRAAAAAPFRFGDA